MTDGLVVAVACSGSSSRKIRARFSIAERLVSTGFPAKDPAQIPCQRHAKRLKSQITDLTTFSAGGGLVLDCGLNRISLQSALDKINALDTNSFFGVGFCNAISICNTTTNPLKRFSHLFSLIEVDAELMGLEGFCCGVIHRDCFLSGLLRVRQTPSPR
jgi:hypothetical protein